MAYRIITAEEIKNRVEKKIKEHFKSVPPELKDIVSMDLSSERVRQAISSGFNPRPGITLIIGPGGCGKSLIYKSIAHTVGSCLCLAPTGIATINLASHGWIDKMCPAPVTINRGLGIPPRAYLFPAIVEDVKKQLAKFSERKLGGSRIKLIMVDEISMVSPNLLDVIIRVSGEENIPLLLFGDPMQLRPVKQSAKDLGEKVSTLISAYPDWSFFYSYGWMMLQGTKKAHVILLDSIYRQSDPGFKSLLNRVRVGELTEEDYECLESRKCSVAPSDALILCKTNSEVNRINSTRSGREELHITLSTKVPEYSKIKAIEVNLPTAYKLEYSEKMSKKDKALITALLSCDFPSNQERQKSKKSLKSRGLWKDEYEGRDVFVEKDRVKSGGSILDRGLNDSASNYSDIITLAPYDRIMFTKNFDTIELKEPLGDEEFGTDYKPNVYVANGMMGRYIGFRKVKTATLHSHMWSEAIIAILDDGRVILVPMVSFSVETLVNYNEYKVIDRAMQFPVKLAYAITLHKSQGLTLDKCHLILGGSWFEKGMAYLGLSRCKTLEGLTIGSLDAKKDFIIDNDSKNFLSEVEALAN